MSQSQVDTELRTTRSTARRDEVAHGLQRRRRRAFRLPLRVVLLPQLSARLSRIPSAVRQALGQVRRRLTPPAPKPGITSNGTPAPSTEAVVPPGMVLMSPWRARLPQIITIVLAVATALILLRGLLTPAAPKPVVTSKSTPAPPAPLVGHLAPNVTLLDLSGKSALLSSLRGKVVVLNFWYVACEPCLYEMPALEKTYLAQQGNGFVVVGVNTSDDAQSIKDFLGRLGVTYPILRDVNLNAVDAYSVTATPPSYVIDRRGVIRDRILGPVDQAALSSEVAALLKES